MTEVLAVYFTDFFRTKKAHSAIGSDQEHLPKILSDCYNKARCGFNCRPEFYVNEYKKGNRMRKHGAG